MGGKAFYLYRAWIPVELEPGCPFYYEFGYGAIDLRVLARDWSEAGAKTEAFLLLMGGLVRPTQNPPFALQVRHSEQHPPGLQKPDVHPEGISQEAASEGFSWRFYGASPGGVNDQPWQMPSE